MNVTTFFFWLIASITGICAIAVVVSQNIVRTATYLLFTLAGTSGIFFLLSADFVGATQLIVYVGGIMVLVVFGVMLTAQGPFLVMKASVAEWVIATFVGVLLYGALAGTIMQAALSASFPSPTEQTYSSIHLGEALMGVPESAKFTITGLSPGVTRSRSPVSYLLPFEIVSVHLLVVLIGAAYLARAKRRKKGTRTVSVLVKEGSA